MKYKTGDMVTVPLNLMTAKQLNEGGSALFHPEDIVEHVSAPHPIVAYLNVYENCIGHIRDSLEEVKCIAGSIGIIKLTYGPSTNTATAEVVND